MEEEIKMTEKEQGDAASNEGKASVEMPSSSPIKRGRGRPQGSKKLKVCITDVNLTQQVSNGGSKQSPRGRGRPKLTKDTVQEGSGDHHADNSVQTQESNIQASNEDSPTAEHSPRKRGRPRNPLSKSSSENADAKDLQNGGSDTPKRKRGRPKGSTKRKFKRLTSGKNEGSSVTRWRQRGSRYKKPMLETEVSSEEEEEEEEEEWEEQDEEQKEAPDEVEEEQQQHAEKPHRGRGRPKKKIVEESEDEQELDSSCSSDDAQPVKRGRGRPKGSLNKNPPSYRVHSKVGQPKRGPPTQGKRGRPTKQPAQRGRPRKYPLPSPEELKKPKVWKPLGRPRKYPPADPPEGSEPPRRSRGRPFKTQSKKGAHLRKSWPASTPSPPDPNVGSQRKRGRPPGPLKRNPAAKWDAAPTRKSCRPKRKTEKSRSETKLEGPNHSKAENDSSPAEVKHEAEAVEEELEHNTETSIEPKEETSIEQLQVTPTEHGDNKEESLIDRDAGR